MGFKILNFNIFGVFSFLGVFLVFFFFFFFFFFGGGGGYEDFVDIFLGSSQNWTIFRGHFWSGMKAMTAPRQLARPRRKLLRQKYIFPFPKHKEV